jgi:hypothetical protein
VSFKEELVTDQTDTFYDPDEFGCVREFRFLENRFEKTIQTYCCWDDYTLKVQPVVQAQGVFFGSVLLFIHKGHFLVPPRPEQIIHTRELDPVTFDPLWPVLEAYRIVDLSDVETGYEIYLDKVTA